MKTSDYDIVVVGGGLAGLASAALLAHHGKKVALLERGKLGGRAMTIHMKGFHFNFGAHAIYGRDKSYLSVIEKELGLNVHWEDFKQLNAKYDMGEESVVIPSSMGGLLQTKLLKGKNKFRFAYHILFTTLGFEKGDPNLSIQEWIELHNLSPAVREMMLNLAATNFFSGDPDTIPSDIFFDYYRRLFKTNIPVSFIQGGWEVLINEFKRVITENGGDILEKTKITHLQTDETRVLSAETKRHRFTADQFVFAVPPEQLQALFINTSLKTELKRYTDYEPTYVMFYDVGLKKQINNDFTYIFDKNREMFITDISYYDMEAAPPGGQLLQAVAYLRDEQVNDPEAHQEIKQNLEAFYDKHYPGWRDHLAIPRASKKPVLQAVRWAMNQRGLPTHFSQIENAHFAGDWCDVHGQLSERSFASAYIVADAALNVNKPDNTSASH
ncbi:FAD-dependent oxidoreductase [Salisediminibacterium halotolerans]|uniref:FAD-dependent oxidoreductase n=1 Tax=Salisediminibacterium halotolerans TaxID=517425 RepID=UPI000EAEA5EF|nr:FAD-dependent oxidoreductase [Salisediminibacterium halotolerans]RLJ78032.1 phytoene dehydrogenase-like protein [Actinophytocola xinjiangensis]RPE88630.1 phytoene dehydrogenase-like protein [Salisediminibacterium halotolerans]TWG37009.1 phytoene dehydrogenase-like protein [Salisediminibacterium halotolerans]GEL08781.1 dehydrogenase [Salisediminibacterium halotolerans]